MSEFTYTPWVMVLMSGKEARVKLLLGDSNFRGSKI
jgi:hypothetical protein